MLQARYSRQVIVLRKQSRSRDQKLRSSLPLTWPSRSKIQTRMPLLDNPDCTDSLRGRTAHGASRWPSSAVRREQSVKASSTRSHLSYRRRGRPTNTHSSGLPQLLSNKAVLMRHQVLKGRTPSRASHALVLHRVFDRIRNPVKRTTQLSIASSRVGRCSFLENIRIEYGDRVETWASAIVGRDALQVLDYQLNARDGEASECILQVRDACFDYVLLGSEFEQNVTDGNEDVRATYPAFALGVLG